jgi:hypothetical protein
MELLADLNLREMSQFFDTFFDLPTRLSRGFLAAKLSSAELCAFALVFFVRAPNAMRIRLLVHLATHPSGPLLPSTSPHLFFVRAPNAMRIRLLVHLATHPSGPLLPSTSPHLFRPFSLSRTRGRFTDGSELSPTRGC